ncbi:hypothetical protein EWM64_g7789 [Hericium alpestre]|uniref:Uncharacterized protein n=1 Tax=Hericium alpestre TaxID=135208 RepID=A0A4Y9ZQB4_9AGAM|nr:hypothetical protein EWM64_g7789 [Hericium alpestre]
MLHTVLRSLDNAPVINDAGAEQVPAVLTRMGVRLRRVGPRPVLVTEVLRLYAKGNMAVHFASNVDGTHLAETRAPCDAERTLFIIAIETFITTREAVMNAEGARGSFLN